MHPRFAYLVLPFTRAELPKWARLIDWASTDWDKHLRDRWADFSKVTVRGKNHGLLMNLDLTDWAQRMTYFLGRYYELGVERALDLILRPGDRFVDVGTNIGMITLHARSLVGASGRIDCFEPNPDCVKAVQQHLAVNAITNVVVHACGLAEEAGTLTLNLTSDHSGTATFAQVGNQAVRSFTVPVKVGDDVIDAAPRLIKIDVEGFELRVLKGLRRTLATHKPFVITELIERQLALAGTSVRETAGFLFDLNYRAYGIGVERGTLRHRLALTPIARDDDFSKFADVLWAHADRVAELPQASAA